jgi:hypothetical protein
MAVTAQQLYQAAQLEPSDLGEEIVPPRDTEEEQKAKALAYVEANILPGAESEVAVPYNKASKGNPFPLPDALISAKWPNLDADGIARVSDNIARLYDDAVISYGISKINRQIDTASESSDKDAAQDRKDADAKLAKLIDTVTDILLGPEVIATKNKERSPQSVAVKTVFTW